MMFTGLLEANFSGIVFAFWAAWIVALLVWSGGKSAPQIGLRVQTAFLRILQAIEQRPLDFSHLRPRTLPRTSLLLSAVGVAAFIQRSWFPLQNLRFFRIETYSRVLDLQRFIHRDSPVADGATYVLEPLGILSGLHADSVVRLSGPLFSTLLVLAVAFCAYRFLHNADAAVIAAALVAAWPVISGKTHAGEISSADLAAVYWVLGAAFLWRNWHMAVYAFSTALLISWKISALVAVVAACIAIAYLLVRIARIAPVRFRSIPAVALTGLVVFVLLADCDAPAPDGPFEYEAAAKACRLIAAEFPRNEWLIVSPVQELVFTYGRGWHFELLDFVSRHTIEEVTPPGFAFPYDVRDLFVFVEKQPLAAHAEDDLGSLNLTQTIDRSVLAYYTGLGRGSVEFQAGALLAAYGANHKNLSVYHQDERFIVFHIHKENDARPPLKAG